MNRFWFLLGVCLLSAVALGASRPSPRTHFYDVEYLRPAGGGESAVVFATFYVEVSKEQAIKVLQSELQVIVGTFDPQTDIMCAASDKRNDERPIQVGREAPYYDAAQKRVITWGEYVDAHKKK